MLRWFLVAALTVLVAGAASAGSACDKEKASAEKASIEKASVAAQPASATHCSAAEKASAGAKCTAAEKAACEAKRAAMAAAHPDCPFCSFVAELRAQQGKVTFSAQEAEDGMTVIFAAVSKDDVEAAQAVATRAYAMMSAPAHCSFSKAQMAEKSCDGCKKGLDAFANAAITLENTETGAQAKVKLEKKDELAKLTTFFQDIQNDVKVQG